MAFTEETLWNNKVCFVSVARYIKSQWQGPMHGGFYGDVLQRPNNYLMCSEAQNGENGPYN